jgi:hypothetical protein
MKLLHLLTAFLLALPIRAQANNTELKLSWTKQINDAWLRPRGLLDRMPESQRSAGIVKWDESHILLFFLNTSRSMASRSSTDPPQTWLFTVQVIDLAKGETTRTVSLPAAGINSELAVVEGGLVVSDPNRLTFYSRELEIVGHSFTYVPLHGPVGFGPEATFLDPQYLYASPDQKTLILVDSEGHRSHIYVFDGTNFKLNNDWIATNVAWQHISVGNTFMLYPGFDDLNTLYTSTFAGIIKLWSSPASAKFKHTCLLPIYVTDETLLNICSSPLLVGPDRVSILYPIAKNEVFNLPVAISPDRKKGAIFSYRFSGGGFSDTTKHRTETSIITLALNGTPHACSIQLSPSPHSQVALAFASNSTLIVLNDNRLSAYDPCIE